MKFPPTNTAMAIGIPMKKTLYKISPPLVQGGDINFRGSFTKEGDSTNLIKIVLSSSGSMLSPTTL